MANLAETKPVMIYFYWPDEDADSTDKDIANQVRRCALMDEILTQEPVRRASVLFHCFKCNVKELGELYKKTYKIKVVPKVLFFDIKGNKVWQLTNTKSKPDGIAKKMMTISTDCVGRMKKSGNGGGCGGGAAGGAGGG